MEQQNYPQQNPQAPQNQPAPPNNYMIWSILTTLLCCLPLGVAAIIYSSKVNSLWLTGNYTAANQAASTAKKLSIIAACIGILCFIAYIAIVVIGGVSFLSSLN